MLMLFIVAFLEIKIQAWKNPKHLIYCCQTISYQVSSKTGTSGLKKLIKDMWNIWHGESMHCVGLQSSILIASFLPLTLKTWNTKGHVYDTAINFLLKFLGERTNSLKWSRRTPRQKLAVRICWYSKNTYISGNLLSPMSGSFYQKCFQCT